MTAYEPPADLIQLRRDFVAAETRLGELGRAMPAPTAIASGEAVVPEDQQREWSAVQGECRRLAMEINAHAWWGTVDSRHLAGMALRRVVAAERDDLDQVG